MTDMADTQKLRALLAPIPGSNVLLPGSVVAEVVEYTGPAPFTDAPDWLVGELEWSGWQIPVINFALLAGTSADATISPRSRVLVAKTLTESTSVLHIGFIINGMPHFKNLSTANLAELDTADEEGVFSHVSIDEQPAVIPDLDALAATIEMAVYRNT